MKTVLIFSIVLTVVVYLCHARKKVPCSSVRDCAVNEKCIENRCYVQCLRDRDCYSGEICEQNFCRVGCRSDVDCDFSKACINNQCIDPCGSLTACGTNANCDVLNHSIHCTCPIGLTGDANTKCDRAIQRCGADDRCGLGRYCEDTVCRVTCSSDNECLDSEKCIERRCSVFCTSDKSCPTGFICEYGQCIAGCRRDSECPLTEACINHQCLNPCATACGTKAQCQPVNHRPLCSCLPEHTGDPRVECSRVECIIDTDCGAGRICQNYRCLDEASLLRVCYFTGFTPAPSQVNVTLCTHIIAGFSTIQDSLLDVGNDTYKKMFREVTALKKKSDRLKVLLSVGGGGQSNGFSPAMNSVSNRTRFIASALTVLNDYDFDGLDVDWEFPVWNDYDADDKNNFISFLQEFKLGTMLYASMTGKTLLLTVAVAGPKTIIDKSYNISEMAKSVDFINLMSYDFHDYFWYTPFTDHNSPLFNRSVEKGYFATLNTAWSALYWSEQGMPRSKIMVGIPTYGHTYKLMDPAIHDVDAPANGIGLYGGDITFPQICQFLSSGSVRVFDTESYVPYAYKGYDWISYEDESSIYQKATWIKEHGFGGAMTYDLNTDDYAGICGSVPFPLHTVLYDVFTS